MNQMFPQRHVLNLPRGLGIDSDLLLELIKLHPEQFWLSMQEESSWPTPKPVWKANQFLQSVDAHWIYICFTNLLLLWTAILM